MICWWSRTTTRPYDQGWKILHYWRAIFDLEKNPNSAITYILIVRHHVLWVQAGTSSPSEQDSGNKLWHRQFQFLQSCQKKAVSTSLQETSNIRLCAATLQGKQGAEPSLLLPPAPSCWNEQEWEEILCRAQWGTGLSSAPPCTGTVRANLAFLVWLVFVYSTRKSVAQPSAKRSLLSLSDCSGQLWDRLSAGGGAALQLSSPFQEQGCSAAAVFLVSPWITAHKEATGEGMAGEGDLRKEGKGHVPVFA